MGEDLHIVMHILENKYGLKTNMVAINLLRVG
jgi:hypothetical protein